MNPTQFPSLIQRFFAEHLMAQRNLSPQTVAAYRDTFRLLLRFLAEHCRRPIDQLPLTALTPESVLAFLDYLERQRGNNVRTRNARLAAIRSFVRFALAHAGPDYLVLGQRLLAVPHKRAAKKVVGCLTRDEVAAIFAELDKTETWSGRRDRVFFRLLYNTGARVSEILGLCVGDASGEVVELHGKGRKERQVPLWPQTRRLIRQWCRDNRLQANTPLFPNRLGVRLSRTGVAFRLKRAVHAATRACSSLTRCRISPHTFRHTTALHLLQSGVALEVIALWLGHESPQTTFLYVEADLKMKADCLNKLDAPPPPRKLRRSQYSRLLAFLEAM